MLSWEESDSLYLFALVESSVNLVNVTSVHCYALLTWPEYLSLQPIVPTRLPSFMCVFSFFSVWIATVLTGRICPDWIKLMKTMIRLWCCILSRPGLVVTTETLRYMPIYINNKLTLRNTSVKTNSIYTIHHTQSLNFTLLQQHLLIHLLIHYTAALCITIFNVCFFLQCH